MPNDSKQQAIVLRDSHITKIVLRHIHDITAHAGRSHMSARLCQRFWIPGASGAIRRFLSKCVICKRLHGTVGKQLMSDLPECRILPDDPPFTRVGMDYFGAFQGKKRRGQMNRCSVIFRSCYTSCASGSCFFTRYRCMPQRNQKIHCQKRTSQGEIRIMEPISGQLTVR